MKELDTCNSRPSAAASAAAGIDAAASTGLAPMHLTPGSDADPSIAGTEAVGAAGDTDSREAVSKGGREADGSSVREQVEVSLSHEEEYEQPLAMMLQVSKGVQVEAAG